MRGSRRPVLVVDDHDNARLALAMNLTANGCHVEVAGDGYEALRLTSTREYDCIVSDIRMPGMSGLELAEQLRQRFPKLRLILMSANEPSIAERARVDALGAVVLLKPLDADALAVVALAD